MHDLIAENVQTNSPSLQILISTNPNELNFTVLFNILVFHLILPVRLLYMHITHSHSSNMHVRAD